MTNVTSQSNMLQEPSTINSPHLIISGEHHIMQFRRCQRAIVFAGLQKSHQAIIEAVVIAEDEWHRVFAAKSINYVHALPLGTLGVWTI